MWTRSLIFSQSQGVVSEWSISNLLSHSQRYHSFVAKSPSLIIFLIILIAVPFIKPQARASGISGIVHYIISKCWLCTRVSHAFFHWHRRTHMDVDLHADARDMKCTNIFRFSNSHIVRWSSSLYLSPCRRILVPVNLYSHQNPKHSSKVLLATAWNRPEI